FSSLSRVAPPRLANPRVRRVRLPSTSHCQPCRRAARTRSAIMSIAVSRSRSSNSVPNGRRYLTLYTREPPVVSCRLAEPLGQRRPRLTGESGSPSIWTTLASFTNTFWPQPTAQYGQTDLTTASAVLVRACRNLPLSAAAPSPRRSGPLSCRKTGNDPIRRLDPLAPTLPKPDQRKRRRRPISLVE